VQELGGSTARQPAQAGQWKYFTPQMPCSVYEWRLARGQEASSVSSSLFCEFEFFCEFGKIRELREIRESCEIHGRCSGTGCAIGHAVVRKIVMCITCFEYSLLLLFIPFLSY